MPSSGSLSPSLIRTLVPMLFGPLFAKFFPGLDITSPDVLLAVSAAAGYGYYVLGRVLETYFPKLGWVLGLAKAPAYSSAPAPSPAADEAIVAVVVDDNELD